MKKQKTWKDYIWIFSLTYLILGFFNILFAWLGLFCLFIPIIIAAIQGKKSFCNNLCGRGQLLALIGTKLSPQKDMPRFMVSKPFRYGFMIFFFTMFFTMLWTTYLVFSGTENLRQTVQLLWTLNIPWNFAYTADVAPWVAQFAFGFYSIMLTSTLIGVISLLFFKPRSWCVFCPMGTLTQLICKAKSPCRTTK